MAAKSKQKYVHTDGLMVEEKERKLKEIKHVLKAKKSYIRSNLMGKRTIASNSNCIPVIERLQQRNARSVMEYNFSLRKSVPEQYLRVFSPKKQ
jgi:hypothetical protein